MVKHKKVIDMKKFQFKYKAVAGALITLTVIYSCSKFLDKPPVGSLSANVLASKAGVDGLLIGAYSMLDGWNNTYNQYSSPYGTGLDNPSFGGYASDDAYKGSNTTDQAPDAPSIENHSVTASIGYVEQKYQADYNGIQRANDAIREIPLVTDGSVTPEHAAEVIAEARFLRGVFHFDAAKVWRNVPYVNETVTYAAGNYNVPNPGPIWDSIEADFTAAMAVLPKTQSDIGRANFYAAEAFLAKALIFDHQYATALPLLTDVINNGVTSSGAAFKLGPYEDNFDASHRNNPESVFCIQMTVNDGSGGQNSNPGDILNFAAGTYTGCCGFYQPSYTLANAFKTDPTGLPMFQTDPATGFPLYNVVDLPNDHGLQPTDPFTPPSNNLDPRIDWTLGRRGIPYLDWGLCGGEAWSRGDIVPYNPIKNVFWHNAQLTTSENSVWGATNQGTAINYNLIRLADVYLWRAECYVEANKLLEAQNDVDTVRNRMAAHPEYWVHTYVNNADPTKGFTNTPAANYVIALYGNVAGKGFAANGQAYARAAVYMERQLEFGMEGHRFFDLQRYDAIYGGPAGANYMANVENAHIKADCRAPHPNPVLTGAVFTAGTNELYPLPQNEIDLEAGKLKQNPNY
jgi:starch-binding outer membrane protein, SusD/RagB family